MQSSTLTFTPRAGPIMAVSYFLYRNKNRDFSYIVCFTVLKEEIIYSFKLYFFRGFNICGHDYLSDEVFIS